jgi:hypothetical protein
LQLGLSAEHVPDLIRMATDSDLLWTDSESAEVWAPVHAWRALGQLRAESAIEPLVSLWNELDEDDAYEDWILDEMPETLLMIGEAAIPALETYVTDPDNYEYARASASDTLTKFAEQKPELRDRVVAILTRALSQYERNTLFANSSLITDLVDLKALESAATIKAAFYAKRVDLMVQGQWSDIAEELGLDSSSVPGPEPEPEDMEALRDAQFAPMRELFSRLTQNPALADLPSDLMFEPDFDGSQRLPFSGWKKASALRGTPGSSSLLQDRTQNKSQNKQSQKAKSKRKQEKKSRKQNRKRK